MSDLSGNSEPGRQRRPRFGVLLVEDNVEDERLTTRALREASIPIKLEIARDGPEALDVIARNASVVHLVLLDKKLPKLSGSEVLRAIRAEKATRHLPVVMFTSSDDPREMRECYEDGANSYITKPMDLDKYHEVVGQAAEYWLTINQVP